MPSIKKRVTGFIRQLSAPNGAAAAAAGGQGAKLNAAAANGTSRSKGKAAASAGAAQRQQQALDPDGFILKYLKRGENHEPGPEIFSGKTGQDLPEYVMCEDVSLDVFAAFTGPEGGITSLSCINDLERPAGSRGRACEAAEDCEDFDYIDLEDLKSSRRSSDESESKANHRNAEDSAEAGGKTQNSAVINSKENAKPNQAANPRRSPRGRAKRERSVENDYPELAGDFFCSKMPLYAPGPVYGKGVLHSNQWVGRRLKLDLRNDSESVIAGVQHWNRPNNAATGQAVTLYERHPFTAEHAGNPIADTFAVVARKNSAILVLGDGVNWGSKAALASRCAVSGCIEYLNDALFHRPVREAQSLTSTQQVFQHLLRSFHAAHSLILQENAQLTTLTACVVLPVKGLEMEDRFAACACNVGDSLAYVYSPEKGHVRELTQDSHDIQSNRDMRDALGALGPVDGKNPELSNLTYSLTFVEPGDIIFLTSDGISDNFDPVVGKFCVPVRGDASGRRPPAQAKAKSLPSVEAYQRHELTLLRMEDILNHGSGNTSSASGSGVVVNGTTSAAGANLNDASSGRVRTSAELCHRMVDFCQRLTTAKRKILEDPDLYPEHTRHALPDSDATRLDQKQRRRKVCEKLALVPGKLDHATIVAYTVEDRRQSLQDYKGTCAAADTSAASLPYTGSSSLLGSLRAPCASSEDLTLRDEDEDHQAATGIAVDEGTPTPSVSLCSSPSLNCGSLAVTPVHQPKQDIDLCFKGEKKESEDGRRQDDK